MSTHSCYPVKENKVTEEIRKGDLDSESNDSKMKGKGDGEKLFELKTGSGKDDSSPAKSLRKRNVGSPAIEKRQQRK
jgi:hypothetical protein